MIYVSGNEMQTRMVATEMKKMGWWEKHDFRVNDISDQPNNEQILSDSYGISILKNI